MTNIELAPPPRIEPWYGDLTISTAPSPSVLTDFLGDRVDVVRFVDIYHRNATLWRANVPFTAGVVSIDSARDERRNFDLTTLGGGDGIGDDVADALPFGPGDGLWYDKIIKPYSGIRLSDGNTFVSPLGVFLVDRISRPHFPSVMKVTCSDFVKALKLDKFAETTSFAAGLRPQAVVDTLLVNAGVMSRSINMTAYVGTLPEAVTFESGSSRWDAIKTLLDGIGYEGFFDVWGTFVARPFVDPATAPSLLTLEAGRWGNIVSYERETEDSNLFNDIVVRGNGPTNGLVVGRATNIAANSPTSVAKIGRRTDDPFENPTVATNAAANVIARSLLAVAGLESYNVAIEALTAPWLEAGSCIEFIPTESAANEPTRFLLSDFSIPLTLEPMEMTAKRVHIVGTT